MISNKQVVLFIILMMNFYGLLAPNLYAQTISPPIKTAANPTELPQLASPTKEPVKPTIEMPSPVPATEQANTTPTATEQVRPTKTATKQVLPTKTATEQVLPTKTVTEQMPPTASASASATSLPEVPTATETAMPSSTMTAYATASPPTLPTNTASPISTANSTSTASPINTASPTNTQQPKPSTTQVVLDPYEDDTPPNQPGYAGAQERTFNPVGDVDYVRYLLKANLLTWFETSDLTNGADTELKIYHDEDGILTKDDALLASDDDSGSGLGSHVQLIMPDDLWLTIVIQNTGSGWGSNVGYSFAITTKQEQTATPTPTPLTPTVTPFGPTNTPLPGSEDQYENDTPPTQPGYAGSQQRTFNPVDDVDYIRYLAKADLETWFETSNLTNAADTVLLIYSDKDGILSDNDILLASDDDSGVGLASYLSLRVETDTWLTIVIENKSTAWGPDVGYEVKITTSEELTATPTPTITPTGTYTNSEDSFEDDTPPNQSGYAGPQRRTFNPAGDTDYVRYLLKANLPTWIETGELNGGADTYLEIYHDTDGILTSEDPLLASDDDGGSTLGSSVNIQAEADLWLTIVIFNRGTGWGENVAYTLSIVTAEDATPTITNTPTITKTPKPSNTPRGTETPQTPEPTETPTETPTITVTPTITPTPSDIYENDALNMPGYAGAQQRTFNPVGDVDYVRYHAKAGLRVWFETTNLTVACDTEILVHRDDYGTLLEVPLVASDDDGGSGLGSRLSYQAEQDQWLTIVIRNRSSAWGEDVGYIFRIITDEEATPTVTGTLPPTNTSLPNSTPLPPPAPTQTPRQTTLQTATPIIQSPQTHLTDKHENDTPPHIALYSGPEQRTFDPYGDVDYYQYFLKAGLTTWFETTNLGPGTDPRINLIHDKNENKTIDQTDIWLIEDDDSGEGLGSKTSLTVQEDAWLIIKVENRSTAWGENSTYILEITTAEEITPTPKAEEPSGAAGPRGQAPEPPPIIPPPVIPPPVIPPPVIPPQLPEPSPSPEQETIIIQPDPLINPTSLKVEIFLDINNDSIMNWGEEINDILVYLTTANRSWNTEAYTTDGEVLIPIVGAPEEQELIVIVPYLHRSGVIKVEKSDLKTKINLDMPTLPSFLP